ncbi:hypothetical protein RFI_12577 [Reticulomyxa filosa]|uniref:t-SNARE coiled-coil homology domain-containing protein n=1 Tax=Reticulomyxa filosa TaxID=46433 RepID=X6NE28_RETFI|nr:hypothetical protein RFI_12577 [Reticulomyxa filosa]|eukprot:ETO24580.1 hypothetical protein RFI_12577 [Reticulomyxa filosa]
MSIQYHPCYRDLTRRFMHLRESFQPLKVSFSEHTSQEHIISSPEQVEGLPPVWTETLELIDDDLHKIEQQISLLQSSHANRLRINFNDTKYQDIQVQERTRSITKLFREVENNLKKVVVMGNEKPNETLPYQERLIRLNVMRSRAMKVQGLTKTFRHAQREFLEKLSKQEAMGNRLIDGNIKNTLPPLEKLEQGFTIEQLQQLEKVEHESSQRTRDIIAIAKSIHELAQLFKELSVLVVEQVLIFFSIFDFSKTWTKNKINKSKKKKKGSILDRIDYNVERTVDTIKFAQKEVLRSEKYQKASRSILCIFELAKVKTRGKVLNTAKKDCLHLIVSIYLFYDLFFLMLLKLFLFGIEVSQRNILQIGKKTYSSFNPKNCTFLIYLEFNVHSKMQIKLDKTAIQSSTNKFLRVTSFPLLKKTPNSQDKSCKNKKMKKEKQNPK